MEQMTFLTRRRWLLPLIMVAALAAATPAGGRSRLSAVPVPATGAYFGAYISYGSHWQGSGAALGAVKRFERAIGRRVAIDNRFYGWTQRFPTSLERRDVAAGRIPMITWKAPRLGAILDGSQDSVILARARAVRKFGAPLFIRWAWEMNGDWAEWAGVNNQTPGTHDGAQRYVAAWRHVHDLFARVGATNVSWVWAPNAQSVPRASWNSIAAYYPGDAYVDWVGFSAYNWGSSRQWSRWSSFRSLVSRMYAQWSSRKPLMVAETSSVGSGARKARWLTAAAGALEHSFPRLKAVVVFQQSPAWTLTAPRRALRALRALANEPSLSPLAP
jgi:hypothetical protein